MPLNSGKSSIASNVPSILQLTSSRRYPRLSSPYIFKKFSRESNSTALKPASMLNPFVQSIVFLCLIPHAAKISFKVYPLNESAAFVGRTLLSMLTKLPSC